MSQVIDDIARSVIALTFYYELEKCNGIYKCSGYILCCIRHEELAFQQPFCQQVLDAATTLHVNNEKVSGLFGDRSYFGADRNIKKQVEFETTGRFSLTIKQKHFQPRV
jgi:hypothetical protein